MMGRREFGLAGLSAAAVVAMQSTGLAQPGERQRGGRTRREDNAHPDDYAMFDECAQACDECQRKCDICTTHCTEMLAKGMKEHAEALRTCQDCADICSAAARIVARKGPFSTDVCKSCEEACAKCGEVCEQFPDDAIMKHCAEVCRACEEACREMIAHLGQRPDDGQDRDEGQRR